MVTIRCRLGQMLAEPERVASVHSQTARKPREERTIPAFNADGSRRRNYSLESAKRQIALKLVVAVVNKRGVILAIEFLPAEGATSATRHAPHFGTRYSILERVTDSVRCWKLKPSTSI